MQDINDTIAANVGLIHAQLRKFRLSNDPDAESTAYEALYNAIRTYKNTGKAKFSTYATVCIYNALGTYVRALNKKKQFEIISYNTPVYNDGRSDCEIIDLLPHADSTEDLLVQECNVQIIHKAFNEVLDTLECKQREIIEIWARSEYTLTTSAIAKEVGKSQSHVSQILTLFRNRLRRKLKEELECSILYLKH